MSRLTTVASTEPEKEVEWDEHLFPVRPYPFMASDILSSERLIAIDANIAFGRPVVVSGGISTAAIVDASMPRL